MTQLIRGKCTIYFLFYLKQEINMALLFFIRKKKDKEKHTRIFT